MQPHKRIRKTLKWGGAAMTVLLAVAWVGSCRWSISLYGEYENAKLFGVEEGFAHIMIEFGTRNPDEPVRITSDPGWEIGRSQHSSRPRRFHASWMRYGRDTNSLVVCWVTLPLWMPIAGVVLPTLMAWQLDTLARRHAMRNLCAMCSYDRTGLRDGAGGIATCPECGTVPTRA